MYKPNNGIPDPDFKVKVTWSKGKYKRLIKKLKKLFK